MPIFTRRHPFALVPAAAVAGGVNRVLFNSFEYLFAFFPLTLALHRLAGGFGERAQQLVLLAASLVFYAWWDVRFLSLLLGSILINYAIGMAIAASVAHQRQRKATALLTFGVTANLAAIGIFKYAGFFAHNLNVLFGTHAAIGAICC